MGRKIQLKRGIKSRLPKLADGELAFVTDEEKVYVGNLDKNIELVNKNEVDELAGFGRTTETIKSISDEIANVDIALGDTASKTEILDTKSTLEGLVEEIGNIIDTDKILGKHITRISHIELGAPINGPLQIEFLNYIAQGDNFSNIKMHNPSTPETNIVTGAAIGVDNKLLNLTFNDLTHSTQYILEIPTDSLKDRFGNHLRGSFTYSFTTMTSI